MTEIFDNEYRELIEEARDAVRKLLDESEHDSWGSLRVGYGQLRDALARDDKAREGDDEKRERQAKIYARSEGERVWKATPAERRESLLLQVLGDEYLIIRELTSRLRTELGYLQEADGATVYDSDVRRQAEKMLHAGELDRLAERFGGGAKFRWRYFRKQALDGPIVDLERRFRDDNQEPGE